MTGTIRLGKGAHREVGSEESRGRNLGFDEQEAVVLWAAAADQASVARETRQATGMPHSHTGATRVNPTCPGEEGMSYLGRSPALSGTSDYRTGNRAGGSRRSQQRP